MVVSTVLDIVINMKLVVINVLTNPFIVVLRVAMYSASRFI